MNEILQTFSDQIISLGGSTFDIINGYPDNLTLSKYVRLNKPVLFKDAFCDWPPLKKWNHSYITELVPNKVKVSVTPDGLADSAKDGEFRIPMVIDMHLKDFFNESLINPSKQINQHVHYIQSQDSNMEKDFISLLSDCGSELECSSFLGKPDAINLWIGSSNSISSLHKDHYENIYIVVQGQKTFTLYPPSDVIFFEERDYPVSQWAFTNQEWSQVDQNYSTKWTTILKKNQSLVHPLTIVVNSGDMLYLPCLWFHQVEQNDHTIAVNYWYDMDFCDSRYSYFELLKSLKTLNIEKT